MPDRAGSVTAGLPAALATIAAVAALAAVAAPSAGASETAAGTPAPSPQRPEALGRKAYVYGLPLLEFSRVRREQTSVACPDTHGNSPVNSFANARNFPGPDDRTVVAPNTDTLYSIAHLDLGHGPIVLSHPNMGKRYFSFELLDPYTNVIDFVGTRETGRSAGRFAVSWKGKPAKTSPGMPVIRSKYRHVWVIGRTLATDRADQRRAYRKMRRYRLSRLHRKPRRFPNGCDPGEPGRFPTPTDGRRFVAKLNRELASNPPPRRDRPLLERLATVGVGPGLSPEDAGLPPETLAALYEAVSSEAARSRPLPASTRSSSRSTREAGCCRRATSATTAPTTTSAPRSRCSASAPTRPTRPSTRSR